MGIDSFGRPDPRRTGAMLSVHGSAWGVTSAAGCGGINDSANACTRQWGQASAVTGLSGPLMALPTPMPLVFMVPRKPTIMKFFCSKYRHMLTLLVNNQKWRSIQLTVAQKQPMVSCFLVFC